MSLASQYGNTRLVSVKAFASFAPLAATPFGSILQPIASSSSGLRRFPGQTFTASTSSRPDPTSSQDKHDFTTASEAKAEAEQEVADDLSPEAPAITPWYLQVDDTLPSPTQTLPKRSWLPELPEKSPVLLQPILEYMSIDLGLDALSVLDLRKLDPPSGLGSNLLMVLATARSEKHLHVSADRFCRWLRASHQMSPYADGLMGRGELKVKLRRKTRRAKLLSSVGSSEMINMDDGLRTGWICVNVGVVETGESALEICRDPKTYVGFGGQSGGAKLVVQMMTGEKREELELEELWGGMLARQEKREAIASKPLLDISEEVGLRCWEPETEPSDVSSLVTPSHSTVSIRNHQQTRSFHTTSSCDQLNESGEKIDSFSEPKSSCLRITGPGGLRGSGNMRKYRLRKPAMTRLDRTTRTPQVIMLVPLWQHENSLLPSIRSLRVLKRSRRLNRLRKTNKLLTKAPCLMPPKKTTYPRVRRRPAAHPFYRKISLRFLRKYPSTATRKKSRPYLSIRPHFFPAQIPLPSQQASENSINKFTTPSTRKTQALSFANVRAPLQSPDQPRPYFEKISRPSTKGPIALVRDSVMSVGSRISPFVEKTSAPLSKENSVQPRDRSGPYFEKIVRPSTNVPISLVRGSLLPVESHSGPLVQKASKPFPEDIPVQLEDRTGPCFEKIGRPLAKSPIPHLNDSQLHIKRYPTSFVEKASLPLSEKVPVQLEDQTGSCFEETDPSFEKIFVSIPNGLYMTAEKHIGRFIEKELDPNVETIDQSFSFPTLRYVAEFATPVSEETFFQIRKKFDNPIRKLHIPYLYNLLKRCIGRFVSRALSMNVEKVDLSSSGTTFTYVSVDATCVYENDVLRYREIFENPTHEHIATDMFMAFKEHFYYFVQNGLMASIAKPVPASETPLVQYHFVNRKLVNYRYVFVEERSRRKHHFIKKKSRLTGLKASYSRPVHLSETPLIGYYIPKKHSSIVPVHLSETSLIRYHLKKEQSSVVPVHISETPLLTKDIEKELI